MDAYPLLLLLGLSVLIILLSALGRRVMRKRSEGGAPASETVPPRTMRQRSAIWSSPVWNVVGVLAGVVGAVVAVIGLFT